MNNKTFTLDREDKITLLKIARQALSAYVSGSDYEPEKPKEGVLTAHCGLFVTLKHDSALRGCIGQIKSNSPLYLTVAEMAVQAGVKDPRFEPVNSDELPYIEFEISVLTPLKLCESIDEIEIGRDGLLIKSGICQGLLLPQVASERKWDRETFLENTCIKAGLSRDEWKSPQSEIFYFSAIVFGEKDIV